MMNLRTAQNADLTAIQRVCEEAFSEDENEIIMELAKSFATSLPTS